MKCECSGWGSLGGSTQPSCCVLGTRSVKYPSSENRVTRRSQNSDAPKPAVCQEAENCRMVRSRSLRDCGFRGKGGGMGGESRGLIVVL